MNVTLLFVSTLFSGLMAGLFYAWSISVTPGIGQIDDASYLRAFQSMNRAIINPLFIVVFLGLQILLFFVAYQYYQAESGTQFWLILTAAILYAGGVMLVTGIGNVPLNNTLEALNIPEMNLAEMREFREGFEQRWNRLNNLRTLMSLATFASLIVACLIENNFRVS
ncbi:MAG: hypothetical protein SCALA702_09500 [Melioribacteraceae bacterium]|nr:MAG: hypothetical protein SCALA702_09500 [Melioribacteraceae bacterium]